MPTPSVLIHIADAPEEHHDALGSAAAEAVVATSFKRGLIRDPVIIGKILNRWGMISPEILSADIRERIEAEVVAKGR